MNETINVERVWGNLEKFFADFIKDNIISNNINILNGETRITIGARIRKVVAFNWPMRPYKAH